MYDNIIDKEALNSFINSYREFDWVGSATIKRVIRIVLFGHVI